MTAVSKGELVDGILIFISYAGILALSWKLAKAKMRKTLLFSCLLILLEGAILIAAANLTDSAWVIGAAYVFGLIGVYVIVGLLILCALLQIAIWLGAKKIKTKE